jgi:hypothetical protein
MASPQHTDPCNKWLTTLSWPDRVIARFLPRFFKRYAPDEIQKQWTQYLEKKEKSGN